jgi:hypothetical protein
MNLTPPDSTLSVAHQSVITPDTLWDVDVNTPITILHLRNVATFTLHTYYVFLQSFWQSKCQIRSGIFKLLEVGRQETYSKMQ